jgi:hypothetical protein
MSLFVIFTLLCMAESNMNITKYSMSYDSIPSGSINWKKFNSAFGSTYTVNSLCDKPVYCTDWWCIYDNCISPSSPSRPKPYIIRIAMPEIRLIPYFLQ